METHTGRIPYVEGRKWSYAAPDQGIPKIADKPSEVKRQAGFLYRFQREYGPVTL